MKKIIFSLLCIVALSAYAQQKKVATTSAKAPASDFCVAVDRLMKHSFDQFSTIKGAPQTFWREIYTDHFWLATDSLPGFTSNNIRATITNKFYYYAVYFHSTDTAMAVKKYNELIDMMKSCVPNLCCSFQMLEEQSMADMRRYGFWTQAAKPGNDKRFEKMYISVNYQVKRKTNEGEVFITIGFKE